MLERDIDGERAETTALENRDTRLGAVQACCRAARTVFLGSEPTTPSGRPGVQVKIAIEIQAESPTGFDDGLQRTVKENCNVLRFKNAEFEEGE